jgi:hypothetical protein
MRTGSDLNQAVDAPQRVSATNAAYINLEFGLVTAR